MPEKKYLKYPSICVPLVAANLAEAYQQVERLAAKNPDLIEVRLDYLAGISPQIAGDLLQELHGLCSIPLLATFRRKEEGGASPHDEVDRLAILKAALTSGAIKLLDVELRTGETGRARLLGAARQREVGSIISYHDFEMTPTLPELRQILEDLAATGADILKLAVMPKEPLDALNLLTATHEAKEKWPDRQLITMAMGGLGGFTRLVGPLFGSTLTFAIGEKSSAPGQPDIDMVRKVWQNWSVSLE